MPKILPTGMCSTRPSARSENKWRQEDIATYNIEYVTLADILLHNSFPLQLIGYGHPYSTLSDPCRMASRLRAALCSARMPGAAS